MSLLDDPRLQCPLPAPDYPSILLTHGGGGRLMHRLIREVFVHSFASPELQKGHDSAVMKIDRHRLAFTTDSYVVRPLFFPGGDIGMLAVNGTVNDLAMSGARPLALSAAFIIEEGLPTDTLCRITRSMQTAAEKAGIRIVTGDTKVVDKGKGDGVFITTAGIGVIEHDLEIEPERVRPGDAIILSGDVGRHGVAVISEREGLRFETTVESDCAPLAEPVSRLLDAGIEVHCLRDLTRGGLATVLVEIAERCLQHLQVQETAIPVLEEVGAACEILGFDPLYVANEGRLVAFVPQKQAQKSLEVLIPTMPETSPCIIGTVLDAPPSMVTLRSRLGSERILDMLSSDQLPRIC